ncbi:N-acetylmuramoyl-L-alanine amidase family protein [Paenibacillus woosongensis]|uniref:N-acetylmuramoyl-L-alanine amidase family protein n=1 Tax=Paenibacillus woosongensis TaxID=307580 RepID=A0AA95KSB5_9BACL|nr:N-acetylmuramoyl-L-alanine amidase family protein [Paenibacillus woosongensis]WHX47303.1 N-acetylmuramoyl-L-alanine amidase family protein [Paenibacillus woosongensis]
MRRIGFLVFILVCIFAFPTIGQAAGGGTSIYLNGEALNLPKNGQVQNVKGNVMIPIRVVMEELGFDVDWEKGTRTVTIKQSDTTIKLVLNQASATVNGKKLALGIAPILKEDTTLVPLRFVSEQMGLTVGWDNATKTVYLITPDHGSGNGIEGNTGNTGSDSGSPGNGSGIPVPEQQNLAGVKGIGFDANRLIIAVDKNVTPDVFRLTGPDRIVIDIPNARFDESFSSNHSLDAFQTGFMDINDYPDVTKIRYSQFSDNPSTIRIVMDLSGARNYSLLNANDGYVIIDLNVDQSYPSKGSGKPLVVIDAGHGGTDPGAISVTKKKEKDLNLSIVKKVEALLKKETQLDYVLTRSTDVYVTLQDRAKLANNLNADVFVSIHANSGSATASGVETYYTRQESVPFANVMHKYLVKSSGLSDRKVRAKSLHVTRETTMPAVLLEVGYLSNKSDEALLYTEKFQNSVAQGVVDGIKEYLGLK